MKYVFVYWVNRSQLLELYHKSKYGKELAKRKLRKEGRNVWGIIKSGDPGIDLDKGKTFREFVEKLVAQG